MLSKIYKPKLKKGITWKLAKKEQKPKKMRKNRNSKSENVFHQPELPKKLSKDENKNQKRADFENETNQSKFPTPIKSHLWKSSEFSKKRKTISILTLFFVGNAQRWRKRLGGLAPEPQTTRTFDRKNHSILPTH